MSYYRYSIRVRHRGRNLHDPCQVLPGFDLRAGDKLRHRYCETRDCITLGHFRADMKPDRSAVFNGKTYPKAFKSLGKVRTLNNKV